MLSQPDAKLLKEAGGKGMEVKIWSEGATRDEVVPLVEKRIGEAKEWRTSLA